MNIVRWVVFPFQFDPDNWFSEVYYLLIYNQRNVGIVGIKFNGKKEYFND